MRLIDADAVIRCECGLCDGHCNTFDGEECLKCTSHNKCQLREAIDDADTVDAEIVRRGEWLAERRSKFPFDGESIKCSVCYSYVYKRTNYCPNCGAKMMDGGKQETW